LNIDENIKVNHQGKKESFLKRLKDGSKPPSSASSFRSSIGFRDSY
jgi:hypothetical protein